MARSNEQSSLPSQEFFQLARTHLSSSLTEYISLPKTGFSSWSPAPSQIFEFSSPAYAFASTFPLKDLTQKEYGNALNTELKQSLEYAIKVSRVSSAASEDTSEIYTHLEELNCKSHIRVETSSNLNSGVLRRSKEILNIYISLSPLHTQEKEGVQRVIGCWTWSVVQAGPWSFFWGKDLCLDEQVKTKRGWREWMCCSGVDGEVEGEEERKLLLIEQ